MRGSVSRVVAVSALVLTFIGITPIANAADDATTARPLITQPIDASKLVQLPDETLPQMKTAQDEGQVATGMPMPRMELLLKRTPEQQQALETVVTQVHTPGSPMYHQPLTTTEYTETFGLAASDLSAIQQWLESYGLKVIAVDNGRLAISFSGTAGQVEAAFHTEIHNYRTADMQVHYANANAAQIPAALANVVAGVSGLQNFNVPHDANYEAVVIDPKAANVKVAPAMPALVGRVGSLDSIAGQEGVFPSSGNILTYLNDNSDGNPKAGIATTTSVTLTPNTVTYAAVGNVAIQAKLTWTGSATPTGSISLYDTENDLYEQILLTTCALNAGTSTYTCTFNWNGAGAVSGSPDTITAAYLGDSTYSASSGTRTMGLRRRRRSM